MTIQREMNICMLAAMAALCLALPVRPADSADAKTIYRKRCTACHTFGKGVKVGPVKYPFYSPRGEFRVDDLDGYTLFVSHAD